MALSAEDAAVALRAADVLRTSEAPLGLGAGHGRDAVFAVSHDSPAPHVEFELKHAGEDVERLKFNYMGLASKAAFLGLVGDAETWRGAGTSRWTPGEVSRYERETTGAAKEALRAEKRRTAALAASIAADSERILLADDGLATDAAALEASLASYAADAAAAQRLWQAVPADVATRRTGADVRADLDEQSVALERVTAALERRRSAVADLERLDAMLLAETDRISSEVEAVRAEAASLSGGASGDAADAERARTLRQLCEWYTGACAVLSSISGVSAVETPRADHLVVSLLGGAAHVHAYYGDAGPGRAPRLREVRVGSTGGTPRRSHADAIAAAVAMDDLPYAVRSVISSMRA